MPSASKKRNKKQPQSSKSSNFILPLIQLAIDWLYGYLKDYYMPGMIIVLILAIAVGKPVGIEWLLIVLIILLFLLLHYLIKKLDPEGTKDNDC